MPRDFVMAAAAVLGVGTVGLTSYAAATDRSRIEPTDMEMRVSAEYLLVSSPSRPIPDMSANLNPLVSLRQGKYIEKGNYGNVTGGLDGSFSRYFSYAFSPGVTFSSANPAHRSQFELDRIRLTFHQQKLELTAGKDNIHWGIGHHGSMLFSGNSESLYLAKISNSSAVYLPGALSSLGPTRSQLFLSMMDGEQVAPYSKLIGMRATFAPYSWWELSCGYVIQLGGEGANSGNITSLLGDGFRDATFINRAFLFESRFPIASLGIEPYLELYTEDCCDEVVLNPRDTLNLFGIFFPNVANHGDTHLSIEWVRTNSIAFRHDFGNHEPEIDMLRLLVGE